jgi:hypothetical protein
MERNENLRELVNDIFTLKSADDTAPHVLKVVDNATREGQGGRFMNWDGTGIPW